MPRRIALGVGIGGVLLLVLDAVAVRIGLATGVIPQLAGTSAWITSRAAGVTAFLALTLDVIVGLCVSTGAADKFLPRGRSVEVHRWLSTVALATTGVHALALLADRFVRFDLLDVLVPFVSSYRVFAVALGVLAAYGAALVHASFSWRRSIGPKTWRKVHALSFLVFAAACCTASSRGATAVRRACRRSTSRPPPRWVFSACTASCALPFARPSLIAEVTADDYPSTQAYDSPFPMRAWLRLAAWDF